MRHRPLEPPQGTTKQTRLTRRVALARLVLAWERLWPLAIWPAGLAALFVALALLDVFAGLAGWLHGLVLSGFAGLGGYLAWRMVPRFRFPTKAEGCRRLERDSGLEHRPLSALDDRRAGGDDPVAEALWQAHLRRMDALVGRLRLNWPEPGMAARDPWGVRAGVLLLLVIALTVGGHDASRRLARAIHPDIQGAGLGPESLEVWITPPSYTGAPPLRLTAEQADPVAVPAGSTLLAVLTGGWGTAVLDVDGRRTDFTRQGDNGQRIETQIAAGHTLSIRQGGFGIASWPLQVGADALPSAEFAAPPEVAERGRLHFETSVSDDWGVAKAWVEFRRLDAMGGEPLKVDLPLAGGRPRTAGITSWHDLTAHPWSGLPVMAVPVAADALGQEGRGPGLTLTLPERTFTHPVARLLVEQRRLLTEDRANRLGAAELLDRVTADPAAIDDDLTVLLALRVARAALGNEGFDLAEVQDLLWNAALRLEEGDLASAEKALEEARRALEQAVDGKASPVELQQAIEAFQQALARYLDALAQKMAGQPAAPMRPGERVIGAEELAQMMEAMRDMAETGSRDALKQMLQDLNQMLSALQAGPPPPPSPEAMQAMRDLSELTRKQQQMLDKSFTEAQRGAPPPPAAEAQAQDGLRNALKELSQRMGQAMGEPPGALGDAGEAMGEAAKSLRSGQWDGAVESQTQAVQALQQAARQAAEQMGLGNQGSLGLVPRDPLGRPVAGPADDGSTRIPGRPDIQRARQILEELRKRAGDWQRPEPERDYLKRLLKQF
jgi:uncharacterized protein (TIGR02302 family)